MGFSTAIRMHEWPQNMTRTKLFSNVVYVWVYRNQNLYFCNIHVQYCAKVMETYFDEFRSFSGLFAVNERNFGEFSTKFSEAYCCNCCEISLWFAKISRGQAKFRFGLRNFRAKFRGTCKTQVFNTEFQIFSRMDTTERSKEFQERRGGFDWRPPSTQLFV